MSTKFDIARLFEDVVNPQEGEVITFMVDLPHDQITDTKAWADRREMAEQWRVGITNLCDKVGARLNPLATFAATGANNGDLPEIIVMGGIEMKFDQFMAESNVCFALTQFSATAPLIAFADKYPTLRAASLPGVSRAMEATALSADYKHVAMMANKLTERCTRAVSAKTIFSTDHEFVFDLRHRAGDADDGYLHADKTGIRVINLPSGEACIVPYEGEKEGDPSRTAGQLPIAIDDDIVVLNVKANRICGAEAMSMAAQELVEQLTLDPARQNIAELGLGCNPSAVISGAVLEDEKVGFHWAYGRSEHLGGVTGPEKFKKPENVLHVDIVYAGSCPITIKKLTFTYPDETEETIIENGEYAIFN